MKSSFLVFFTVLCQCNRESVCFPKNGMSTKGFKLPKPITSETEITINGTMKIFNNLFYVALMDKQRNSLCEMTFDTDTNKVTMSSEFTITVTDEYYLERTNSLQPAAFVLKIEPKMSNKHLINLFFEVDNAGQLSLEPCEVKKLENIHRIIVKGAETITSLLFTFRN